MTRRSAKLCHPCAVACVLTALGFATPGHAAGPSVAPPEPAAAAVGQAWEAQAAGTQIAQSSTNGVDGQAAPQSVRMMRLAGELGALSQSMTYHSLLYALSIKPDDNLRELLVAYEDFGRIVEGLRHGDDGLNLSGTDNPKILAELSKLEKRWNDFGPAIGVILESGQARQAEIEAIAKTSQPMFEAAGEVAEVVAYHATGGRTFSVLTQTVARAERQHALVNEMLTRYLLVALEYRPGRNREALQISTAEFDRTLQGLINGDPGLKVLKAPSRAISEQYRIVQGLWTNFMPLVSAATISGDAERSVIIEVHELGVELSREVNEAIKLYEAL